MLTRSEAKELARLPRPLRRKLKAAMQPKIKAFDEGMSLTDYWNETDIEGQVAKVMEPELNGLRTAIYEYNDEFFDDVAEKVMQSWGSVSDEIDHYELAEATAWEYIDSLPPREYDSQTIAYEYVRQYEKDIEQALSSLIDQEEQGWDNFQNILDENSDLPDPQDYVYTFFENKIEEDKAKIIKIAEEEIKQY